MSQSAIFRLVQQDERFDAFFTGSDYLRQRLAKIRAERTALAADAKQKGLPAVNVQPTFRDLENSHAVYVHTTYRPFVSMACEYVRVSPHGSAAVLSSSPGSASFTFPIYGHFISDMVLRVRLDAVGTQTPVVIGDGVVPPNPSPYYRFCAYPGIRLLTSTRFKSDEVLVDEYTRDDVLFANQFRIPADRRAAWDRGMGQAELRQAEYQIPPGFTGVTGYRDGLQSLKFYHPPRDLWVPLQFFMCEDPANALLNDLIPNTQRVISMDFAPIGEIVKAVDQQTFEDIALPIQKLGMRLELYVNNIFVNPEVHDIFASRMAMTLIRIHRQQRRILTDTVGKIALDQLKFPAEYLYIGVRDLANKASFDHWHLFGRERDVAEAEALHMPIAFWNPAVGACQLSCRPATDTATLEPLLDSFTLSARGIDLYPEELPSSFFNTYTPQRYFDKTLIVAPRDLSAYFVPFCVHPGQRDPSGYYNASINRSMYFRYTSDKISANFQAELVISMSALNFLVCNGDKTTLRYAV